MRQTLIEFDGYTWETPDLDGSFDQYRIQSGDWELERALTREEKLPEKKWPGHPGDDFYGILGTTQTIYDGWAPVNYTGELRISLVLPERGLFSRTLTLVQGKLTAMTPLRRETCGVE